MDKIKHFFGNPIVQVSLITGGLILTKMAAFFIYKEMRKEGMLIDI